MPSFHQIAEYMALVWSSPLFFLLLGCGLTFSVATKFIQWRILSHGIDCIRGRYDNPNDTGQITHFQALSAALSATIGLGNIAGVAVAVSLGGPGAVFWMWVVGFFGMAVKFVECSLAVMFRDVRDVPDPGAPALVEHDAETHALEYPGGALAAPGTLPLARGEVRGGPMWYMQKALVEPLRARGNPAWVPFRALALLFALAAVLAAMGAGNMFQGWNVSEALERNFAVPRTVAATVVSLLVAMVIIGGIKRIGKVAAKLVPGMCVIYVGGALYVLATHMSQIGPALLQIVHSAFQPAAAQGSFAGASVWLAFSWGLRRACFSNEAGEGSAAIAHAAARTNEPIREGVVAGMGPFIDTLLVCTMSALVLLVTDAWTRPAIGVVERVDGERVVVQLAGDLPEHFVQAYARELADLDKAHRRRMEVHLEVEEGQPLVKAEGLPFEVHGEPARGWTAVHDIELTRDLGSETHRAIAAGQRVFFQLDGVELMRFGFDMSLPGFGKIMITLGISLFAFSSMISWSYYGEKGIEFVLGPWAILPYKFGFVVVVFLGMVLDRFETVYNFSDATSGFMVLCNLPAALILFPIVVRGSRDYFRRLDTGDMKPYR